MKERPISPSLTSSLFPSLPISSPSLFLCAFESTMLHCWFSRLLCLCLWLLSSADAFVPPPFGTCSTSTTTTAAAGRPGTARGVAIDTSDIKNGLTVELDGEPYKVLSFSIMKQARGAAKTTIKFKNLMRGNTIENTYRSGEKFETAMIEKNAAQFTYKDENDNFFFMDSATFDEIVMDGALLLDEGKQDWVEEGMEVTLVTFKGNVIEVVVPKTFLYTIVETEPNVKGNTAQGYTKPATLSSGATINVPGYLEQGEVIKVDTEKREFLERAN